jgi:hypothetical protein
MLSGPAEEADMSPDVIALLLLGVILFALVLIVIHQIDRGR